MAAKKPQFKETKHLKKPTWATYYAKTNVKQPVGDLDCFEQSQGFTLVCPLFFFLIIVINLTIQAVFGVALIAHTGEMAVGQLELAKHQTRRDSGAK